MNINAFLGSKKLSNFFWKTYREDPQNIETESHRLLHRDQDLFPKFLVVFSVFFQLDGDL